MRKRILFLALIALLVLPALGITQDVRVEDVEIKWMSPDLPGGGFLAKIWVVNDTDTAYKVYGELIFYDGEGFEVSTWPFSGEVEAGETVPLSCKGYVLSYWLEDAGSYEAVITSLYPVESTGTDPENPPDSAEVTEEGGCFIGSSTDRRDR